MDIITSRSEDSCYLPEWDHLFSMSQYISGPTTGIGGAARAGELTAGVDAPPPMLKAVATKPAASTDESAVNEIVMLPPLDATALGKLTPVSDCSSGELVEGPS